MTCAAGGQRRLHQIAAEYRFYIFRKKRGGVMFCSVHIRNMSLFMRVERMNKDTVCVEEMGKRLGGYVLDKNSREEERRW